MATIVISEDLIEKLINEKNVSLLYELITNFNSYGKRKAELQNYQKAKDAFLSLLPQLSFQEMTSLAYTCHSSLGKNKPRDFMKKSGEALLNRFIEFFLMPIPHFDGTHDTVWYLSVFWGEEGNAKIRAIKKHGSWTPLFRHFNNGYYCLNLLN